MEEDVSWALEEIADAVKLARALVAADDPAPGLAVASRVIARCGRRARTLAEELATDREADPDEASDALGEMRFELARAVAIVVIDALGDDVVKRSHWAASPSRDILRGRYADDVIESIPDTTWRHAWSLVNEIAVEEDIGGMLDQD